jgi:hypothetical protein
MFAANDRSEGCACRFSMEYSPSEPCQDDCVTLFMPVLLVRFFAAAARQVCSHSFRVPSAEVQAIAF